MVAACFGDRLADSFLLVVFSSNTSPFTWVWGWMCNLLVILISLYYHWNTASPFYGIASFSCLEMPSGFPLNYVANSRVAHTQQNNPCWVPFCIQRGMSVRYLPVYLKKESLGFSSTTLFPSTELPGVSGRSSYRQECVSHIRAEEVGSKCRSAGEHQLCLPFLLILSSGSIPSRSEFNRKLTYLLCPLQVLQSVWWWWHVKERGPEVHKSCYKFLITKNHYMCHSSNSWSLHGTHQEAAQLFISHLSDTVRYLWQTLDISSK